MGNTEKKQGNSESVSYKILEKTIKVLGIFFRTFLITAVTVCCVLLGLLVGIVAGCIMTTDKLEPEDLYITGFTSFVYDDEGNVIATLKGSDNINRVWVSKEDVPEDLFDAIVAIEDERFYTHPGVDVKRTVSAFLGYFISGMSSHGGSTLTQQVIKNVTGDDAVSVPRKIREIWRAYQLEKDYDKDQIIEMYVNVIYLGSDLYGVQTGARAYFNKDVSDLNLAECAFLAGITNSPRKYNPLTTLGRTNAYKRQVVILDKMLALGKITEEEYIEAIQTELVFNENYSSQATSSLQTYFVDAVISEVRTDLMAKGYTKSQANNIIYNTGISIYSTQKTEIQNILDTEFCNPDNFPLNSRIISPEDQAQGAMVVLDQYTGKIVAMYGGYGDKNNANAWNRAIYAQRQPGSSIKPLLVYAPLIDTHKITAASVVTDEKVYLDAQHPDKAWPSNHDKSYGGITSVRDAIKNSVNVAAVLFYKDNITNNLQYLKRAGIDRTTETQLSAALGGLTVGVSPLEMAAAYAAFANGGTYYEPITYTEVYDRNGKVILSNSAESTIVYDDFRTSAIMTSMLQSVVTNGTGGHAKIYKDDGSLIPTAGKTGTTTANNDYWFVGYTGYYTAATWYGYDKQTEISSAESGAAVKLWGKIMKQIHENLETKYFEEVSGLVTKQVCYDSGLTPTKYCYDSKIIEEIFIEGTEPGELDVCDVCKPDFDSDEQLILTREDFEALLLKVAAYKETSGNPDDNEEDEEEDENTIPTKAETDLVKDTFYYYDYEDIHDAVFFNIRLTEMRVEVNYFTGDGVITVSFWKTGKKNFRYYFDDYEEYFEGNNISRYENGGTDYMRIDTGSAIYLLWQQDGDCVSVIYTKTLEDRYTEEELVSLIKVIPEEKEEENPETEEPSENDPESGLN